MAETTKHRESARAAARPRSEGALKYWVLQQGSEYYVVPSEKEPDLNVPDGVRRKVIRGYNETDGEAWARAELLAETNHGSVRR